VAVADDTPLQWNPRVASRALEGTAFVLNAGRLVSLNDTGSRAWELWKDGKSITEVATLLGDEFEADLAILRHDLRRFAETLIERQLLVPVTAGHAGEGRQG
jgi:hypothetical protein